MLLALRLVDRVVRDSLDPAVDQPVAGERKGVDLDFRLLADFDKADIKKGVLLNLISGNMARFEILKAE